MTISEEQLKANFFNKVLAPNKEIFKEYFKNCVNHLLTDSNPQVLQVFMYFAKDNHGMLFSDYLKNCRRNYDNLRHYFDLGNDAIVYLDNITGGHFGFKPAKNDLNKFVVCFWVCFRNRKLGLNLNIDGNRIDEILDLPDYTAYQLFLL